ncbi:unnamed protein product [Thlaspi arvense]|uniref:Protein kinase domain-containing protein n=1 Tax=Thlaspi arvense TaxID=13288 RepID=A0AAU9RF64_THLAR|nr:unnamed protein product [Thlaspi arvense]
MRCYYSLSVLVSLLLMLILASKVVTLSSSCQNESCGNVKIPYPFGIQQGCYLNEWYRIECRNATLPFLFKMGMEVVDISLPGEGYISYSATSSFGSIRVRNPMTSVGCSRDGKETGSVLNLTGSPFFFGRGNSLVAAGCNSKASLTNIEPRTVGCELNCTASKETSLRRSVPFLDKTGCSSDALPYTDEWVNCTNKELEGERSCDGNGCCSAVLSDDDAHQVIGVSIEDFDYGISTSRGCRVAFLTDEVYTLSNATKPQSFFAEGYATVTIGWAIQTNALSFLNSLSCKSRKEYHNFTKGIRHRTSCLCNNITISGTSYANCGCNRGYTGNPYLFNGCQDVNECQRDSDGRRLAWDCTESDACVNRVGHYHCVRTVTILIGVGAGFGILALAGGIWFLRKYIKKRKVTQRKKKFFKRNGGLLLEQQLNTREGNVEKTRIFSSRELEKATENFSESRILGQGGQGTVYKGMLVDGRTVAVKKSKAVDEDKLEEFINEVVILSQINHRHVVKLLGCCLETEVPILVYEFIPNGEKPVITLPDSQEIRGLADHFRAAMKENKFFDIMDARIRDACKPEQVVAVAKLAMRCLNSKGKKRPNTRQVFSELENISSSQEDSLVEIEIEDGDDEEEEGMNMIHIADAPTIGVTAPAFSVVASSSSSDVKPLLPRSTW